MHQLLAVCHCTSMCDGYMNIVTPTSIPTTQQQVQPTLSLASGVHLALTNQSDCSLALNTICCTPTSVPCLPSSCSPVSGSVVGHVIFATHTHTLSLTPSSLPHLTPTPPAATTQTQTPHPTLSRFPPPHTPHLVNTLVTNDGVTWWRHWPIISHVVCPPGHLPLSPFTLSPTVLKPPPTFPARQWCGRRQSLLPALSNEGAHTPINLLSRHT
ncbi:unnamed protein product [Cyclocybe aegerita]|uniref:Uncharacterized protein n=1 Tax=Cyclocybe aegerita TaxID=1973307 RepID=A0A8S0WEE6_CYCAE|nr:unnamed protein product [Cyclocybe aegerita]